MSARGPVSDYAAWMRRDRSPAPLRSLVRAVAGVGLALLAAGCTGKHGDKPDTADSADSGSSVPSGPLHLFYKGGPQSARWDDDEVHNIYAASSADGVNFIEEGLVFSSAAGNDPDVFPYNDGYALFTSTGPTLTFATSSAISGGYDLAGEFSWFGGGGPATIEVAGSQRVFYCGANGIDFTTLVLDPLGLSPFESALLNPFGTGHVCDPTVVQLADGTYKMFYLWSPELDSGPWDHQLYSASSTDGLHFTAIDTMLRDQASVPGALIWGDALYLYAVDATGGGAPDTGDTAPPDSGDTAKPEISGLIVGVSTDWGATFSFQEVLIEGREMAAAFDPDAIIVP